MGPTTRACMLTNIGSGPLPLAGNQRETETERAPIASIFYLYNNEGCPTSNFYLLVDTYGSVDDLTCISSGM
jgi:hypothetical protein